MPSFSCNYLAKLRVTRRSPVRLAAFSFIEAGYNPHCRHSLIHYLSPINYE